MTVLFIILGVLMAICGFCCIFTPLLTFMDMTYFIVIMAAVYGVVGIVRAIKYKRYGLSFAFSILSLIFAIALLCLPNLMVLTDAVLIYMVAAWLVMMGVVSIVTSIRVTKKTGSSIWIFQLIIGILGVLLGIYSFFHPAVIAVSLGFLVGFWFIETGFAMIFGGIAIDS